MNARKSLAFVERRIVNHLEPFFGGRRMASITPSDVRAYAAMRQEAGAKNGTINREIAILSRSFKLAQQSGNLLHHIHIPTLREDNTRTGFFEWDQFEHVRQHLPAPLQSVVTFLYCTGWRIGETLPLRWPEIHDGYVHLLPGKTKNNEARRFPYLGLPELADVLETQRFEHDRLKSNGVICPFVFHRDGRPIKNLRSAWRTACAAAGLPGMLIHDFRRTAVRNLVRAGVPDTVSMRLTGQKTRSIFFRYDITSEANLQDAVGKLAAEKGTEKGQSDRFGRISSFQKST